MTNVMNTYVVTARHGRKYGYSSQKVPLKVWGSLSCGLANVPPRRGLLTSQKITIHPRTLLINVDTYPNVPPIHQDAGRILNASARFVVSVMSPITLFRTLTFPLTIPMRPRLAKCRNQISAMCTMETDSPNHEHPKRL
jgi:hypothetical protein